MVVRWLTRVLAIILLHFVDWKQELNMLGVLTPKAIFIQLSSGAGSVPLTLNSCLTQVLHVALSFLLHKSCLSYKAREGAIETVPRSLQENISCPIYITSKIEFPPSGANNETIMNVT